MPGPAYHLVILDKTIESLSVSSAEDQATAKIMKDNLAFARLGALGPDFLRYRPVEGDAIEKILETDDLSTLSEDEKKDLGRQLYYNPEMAPYATAFRVIVPFFADLREMEAFLAGMAVIAADEDIDALKAQKANSDALKPKFEGLQELVKSGKKVYGAAVLANVGGKPTLQAEVTGLAKIDAVKLLSPATWRPVEYMRWKKTGAFARALVAAAEADGDAELMAYAYGYLTHVAGTVVGEPFVNSITGGPYRTHWWRNKWVRNYVDAWTHGRYGTPAAMNGDTPQPDYDQWTSLCSADLHEQVKVDPGLSGDDAVAAVVSGIMPATPGFDKVADLFAKAVNTTFAGGSALETIPAALTDAAQLREAYVGALAVLWFMTANQPLCPAPIGAPPPGAETPPDWYGEDPSGTPPTPSGGGSSTASTASAIIAAILAIIAIVTANIFVGIAALGFIIAAAILAPSVDWNELRGTIYWLQMELIYLEKLLQEGMVKAALAYPQPEKLGAPTGAPANSWTPAMDSSMVALTKSRTDKYPMKMQPLAGSPPVPPDAGYMIDPTLELEVNPTRSHFDLDGYPDAIIDGLGLQSGGMISDNGAFPTRGTSFGGAIANATELVRARAEGLVDYNLDGDRGYGWKTWKHRLAPMVDYPSEPFQEDAE
ncbi:MAG: hypothetical protein COA47_04890 [Robiginitomaculum sp.]|nr:MAG: hypothetical protein COA47_04890 [Robiginitomaculum sp.]